MKRLLRRFLLWLGVVEKQPAPPPTDTELVLESLKAGKCPDCGREKFFSGPTGGMCENICCSNDGCRSAFNVALPWMAERISNYYWHPQEQPE
jgi:hypothetical protein